MLSAKEEHTGKGLGRLLFAASENKGREDGCEEMQLEILQPSEWQHPKKQILHQWYSERLGYKVGEALDFSKDYPQMNIHTACHLKFTAYIKKL